MESLGNETCKNTVLFGGDHAGKITKTNVLAAKNSALWECTSRQKNLRGGWIYTFKVRKEFDDVTSDMEQARKKWKSKLDEIFPAVELLPSHMQCIEKRWADKSVEQWTASLGSCGRQRSIQLHQVAPRLCELGYCSRAKKTGFFLKLPDREALLANWKQLRKADADLPALDVASSEGVAGALEFVKANLTHDVVLSRGKEFVHDHMLHVLSKLSLMLTSGQSVKVGVKEHMNPIYVSEKRRIVTLVSKYYQRIVDWKSVVEEKGKDVPEWLLRKIGQHLPLLEIMLGSMSDTIASKHEYHPSLKGIGDVDATFASNYIFSWEWRVWKQHLSKRIETIEVKSDWDFLLALWRTKAEGWKELIC